jgi:hypothetical protein
MGTDEKIADVSGGKRAGESGRNGKVEWVGG